MQLVVPIAVKNAVSAATITFTASSTILCFFIVLSFFFCHTDLTDPHRHFLPCKMISRIFICLAKDLTDFPLRIISLFFSAQRSFSCICLWDQKYNLWKHNLWDLWRSVWLNFLSRCHHRCRPEARVRSWSASSSGSASSCHRWCAPRSPPHSRRWTHTRSSTRGWSASHPSSSCFPSWVGGVRGGLIRRHFHLTFPPDFWCKITKNKYALQAFFQFIPNCFLYSHSLIFCENPRGALLQRKSISVISVISVWHPFCSAKNICEDLWDLCDT